jgi:PAS domain S-box-containing protein
MDTWVSLLGRSGFLPHGYCFTWTPGLLWSMVGADATIAAAYFSIPVATLSFIRKRPDATLNWVAFLFSAFIFSCGITHLMDIWTIWVPDYGLQALTKIVTAAISLITAVALWPLIPKALKIPSVTQLQTVIASLEAEVRQRRSAEEQLSAIQQSLAVTLASIDAGFIATDRMGRVTRMNAVAEQVTGWLQAEALGQPLWQVYRHDGRTPEELHTNPVDRMQEQGTTIDAIQHVAALARDGHRTPLEVKADLTRNDAGEVTGLAMVFRDMSRLIEAEAESQRLAAIVESSNDAIIGRGLDGRMTSWNRGAQAIFGYSPEEAIGQPVKMLLPPDRQEEEKHILDALLLGETVPAFDTVRLARNGERLDLSIAISPIRDSQGRLVGASKIARDVSQQRRAERALRESEERLRFTLDAAHIGDWELDLASGQMQHSLRHDRCFGYAELQAEWNFDRFIQHVHADDRAEVAQTLHTALTALRDWRAQCRVVWPDGSIHWITTAGNVHYQDGIARRMVGIVIDITEQRQAEHSRITAQRLEVENRQILEANRLKSQFLANMSHELRTPLNAVIGFADLLKAGFVKPDSPKHQEFLGHIATSGRHLLQLINDVLDLSKVESGKFEFYPEPLNLEALLKEVGDTLQTAMARNHVRLGVDIDPSVQGLPLDPARLRPVLSNYLSNAIKFTANGGRVNVRVMAQGEAHFRIEVEDFGIGIAPADLPRLFTEFLQLDAGYSKQHEGTGLGLALTRRLVQAQGGEVGVRSTLGVGSVFYVVLNRIHGRDMQGEAMPEGALPRVLVIEDDQREQARQMGAFSEAGFSVDAASNGLGALRQARDTPYDALTLDLQLPDQRGLDLLANIRSRGASHAAPVVGVSMPIASDRSASFAVTNVLSKPIRSDEILLAMSRFRLESTGKANVLVIDDEQIALDLMRATLKSIGIDAICCLDGRVALQEIEQHRPDAIILDLMMPEFDGFQVLDALQQLPSWREVPVFIWTSMLLTDEEYARLAQSARAIISKGGGAIDAMLERAQRSLPRVTQDAARELP